MRQKRLGNFQTKEGAPAFETYYTLSGEHLTGDLFAIINGQTPFFQLQRYALEDFQYDREVKAYFCVRPDDQSQRYYYHFGYKGKLYHKGLKSTAYLPLYREHHLSVLQQLL